MGGDSVVELVVEGATIAEGWGSASVHPNSNAGLFNIWATSDSDLKDRRGARNRENRLSRKAGGLLRRDMLINLHRSLLCKLFLQHGGPNI